MRPNPALDQIRVPLDLLPFPRPLRDPDRIACVCLHCSSRLSLHQLDPESPDRLLGACEACKHWYLVDLVPGVGEGLLVGLPGGEVIRELSRENPDEGISLMGAAPDPGPVRKPGK